MQFVKKKFYVFIFYCKTENYKIYDWTVWKDAYPFLDALLSISNFTATIHTSQSCESAGNKYLPFGRMIWNLKNNEKWTTKYKVGKDAVDKWQFYDTEIWSPPKTDCFKGSFIAPNIFIKVDDHSTLETSIYFDTSLIVAINEDIYSKLEGIELNQLLEELYKKLNAVKLVKILRPWAQNWNDLSYTECIQDEYAVTYLKDDTFEISTKYDWEILRE